VQCGGHIHIGDFATVGGLTAIHQFVHIGTYAFVGGASAVEKRYWLILADREIRIKQLD
jgi:UDP-N-acetylglucosamine acyltransferase